MKSNEMSDAERAQRVKETIELFIELVFTEKFADMPNWMDLDLTVSQVKSIYLLAHHHALAISELADLLGIGNPAASILVQQLVEQELVERAEDLNDRRRTLVSLTSRGAKLVSGRRDLREAKFRRRLSQMNDEELTGLLNGMKALVEIVRSEQAELANR